MNVSTKSEYGLRTLIYLAGAGRERLVPAREISEAWSVPFKYLEQILKTLKESGIVEGRVGAGGGYRLTRAPSLITAGEVVRLLDGRLAPVGCVSTFDYEPCQFEPICGLKTLWSRTRAAVLGVLDQTTIADIAQAPRPQPEVVKIKSVARR